MLICTAICCALTFCAPQTRADLITFTYEGTGSGTLGGVAFPASAFTITALGDTNNRQPNPITFLPGTYQIDHDAASITISGLGTLTFLTHTLTFVNQSVSGVGFSRYYRDLFYGPTNSAFSSWDMLSSIGPISGSGRLLQWQTGPVETNFGTLVFDDADGIPATFEAVVGQSVVPAPSAIFLSAVGLSFAGWRLKRETA